jgi:hypothetical protein
VLFSVLGASVEEQRSLWPVRQVIGAILRLLQDVHPVGKEIRSERSENCMAALVPMRSSHPEICSIFARRCLLKCTKDCWSVTVWARHEAPI